MYFDKITAVIAAIICLYGCSGNDARESFSHLNTAETAPAAASDSLTNAPDASERVALYRFYGTYVAPDGKPKSYHFYTTDCSEIATNKGNLSAERYGIRYWGEGIEGYLASKPVDGSKPMYRMWNGLFYRYVWRDSDIQAAKNHPVPAHKDPESPIGYVLPPEDQRHGTQELLLYINQLTENYFYSTNPIPANPDPGPFWQFHGSQARVWKSGTQCANFGGKLPETPARRDPDCICHFYQNNSARLDLGGRACTEGLCNSRCRQKYTVNYERSFCRSYD